MQREEVLAILRSHRRELEHRGVKSLALFGSTARGEARPDSDVDLLVEFSVPVGFFEFYDLQQYLQTLLDTSVDLGTLASMKPRVRESALREAVYVS
jgi:predicted nucleotidyltransferase